MTKLSYLVAFISVVLMVTSISGQGAGNCAGLPVNGGLIPSGTYTLASDCVITETLRVGTYNPPGDGDTVTINGNGFVLDGNNSHQVILVDTKSELFLNNVVVRNGNSQVSGGGIYNGGTVVITSSKVTGNVAFIQGGGINNNGNLTITSTTIAGNSSRTSGGIFNVGFATISNSTITNNIGSAVTSWNPNRNAVTVITHTTIANNTPNSREPDNLVNFSGRTLLKNNIIMDRCNSLETFNGSGNITNLPTSGCPGVTVADPLLGEFNGTYYPLLGRSPAIDGAPDCAGLTVDQIGNPRPQGSACDIGAIEGSGIAPPRLNQWRAEINEDRAFAWGMPDNAYGTIHMWQGEWQFTPGGIPQELVDAGVLAAVDVWLLADDGQTQFDFGGYQQICLLGNGRMIFMDATGSPRPMVEIQPVMFSEGYTCGWIPNAGTVILIERDE